MNRVLRLVVGAAALPFLPARMLWMRAMQGAQRASQDAMSNAADALALEAELEALFDSQLAELVPAGR